MFTETHNLIAFLEKPTKSNRFEQIVDFINVNPIKYALTVRPTIYTSCVKQFWTSAKIKTVNGDVWMMLKEDESKQGRIAKIDANEDLSLINETAQDQRRMNEEDLFKVNDLDGDEVIVDITTSENVEQDATVAEKVISTDADEVVTTTESVEGTTAATTLQISKDDVTLAQALIEIKAAKPRAKGVIVQEPSEFGTTSSSQPS
nr:hypothetical protein [Tanacetum cinerariifolium]